MVAFGSVVTVGAGRIWSCSQGVVKTVADANFVTTTSAAKEKSEMQDDYRGLVNEAKNIENMHYLELSKRLESAAADITTVKNYLLGIQSAPTGPRFQRGRRIDPQ